MSDGTMRMFSTPKKRNAFERVAQAVKSGYKPTKKRGNPYQEAANRMAAKDEG